MKRFLLPLFACCAWASGVFAQTASVTPSASSYSTGGGQIAFNVTLTYPANVSAVSFTAKPPAATWLFVSTAGANVPNVQPRAGDNTNPSDPVSSFGFAYTDVPASTATFTFVVSYPAGLSTAQTINFTADYRLNGVLTTMPVTAVTLNPTTAQTAPSFISNPTNATASAGATATFAVSVSANPTASIKWQRSTDAGATFADISTTDATFSGATTATLTIPSVTSGMNNHRFRAVATNGVTPDATSTAATLTVQQAPVITVQPISQSILAGSSVSFSVSATGSGTLTYQWYFTATGTTTAQAISGATAATYTISNVQTAQQGDYVCIVANNVSTATSNAAQLAIVPRLVRVVSQGGEPGANVIVPVELVASGTENGVAFSIQFDPAVLTFVSWEAGSATVGAPMIDNVEGASAGRLGFQIAKNPNQVFSAGVQQILKVTFTIKSGIASGTTTAVSFTDNPSERLIGDVNGNPLPGAFVAGSVSVSAYEADVNNDGRVNLSDWQIIGRWAVGLDASTRPTSGLAFQKADCGPRLNTDGSPRLGDGKINLSDWQQAGRYAVGLDAKVAVGGPTAVVP